jgi:hypothetical protein
MHALMLAKMSSAAVTAPEVDKGRSAPIVARQNGAVLIVSTFHAVWLTTEERSRFLRASRWDSREWVSRSQIRERPLPPAAGAASAPTARTHQACSLFSGC